MKYKILFINSPLFAGENNDNSEDKLPPIGLGYIATNIRNKGHDVDFLDAVSGGIGVKSIIEKIKSEKPDFVAINIFSTNYELVKEIVISVDIEVNFIIGGIVTKSIYKLIYDWSTDNHIDIVFGDGELITEGIVNDNLIQEPDATADNRRFFSVDHKSPYFVQNISNLPLNRSFFEYEPIINHHGDLEIAVVTSRGCIHDCAFCSAARSMNREIKIRKKQKESIKNELEQIAILYPNVTAIRILDDLFLKNRQSLLDAIEIFSETNYNWRSMAHFKTFKGVDQSLLIKLRESGCMELFIGIESGSNRVLKIINKERADIDTLEILRNIFKAQIGVKGYFILGLPSETEGELIQTFEFAKQIKKISIETGSCFRVSAFQFRPYHGTKIYNNLFPESTGNIPNITQNTNLTNLIGGRSSFNFSSGIYSECNEKTLHKYIKSILDLNNTQV